MPEPPGGAIGVPVPPGSAGSVSAEPGDRSGRRHPGRGSSYQDDPTEVLGPIDIGMWTLQRRAAAGAGPAGESTSRPATGSGGGRPPRPDRLRTAVRGVGQTLITVGMVLLLFVVYELWITDLQNDRTQRHLRDRLEQQWEEGDDPLVRGPSGPRRPGEKVRSIPLGDGFALIYIPDFGADYVYTIVEGTDPDELDEGPGHYVDSALPGEVGNFAVAGHRVGKGSPFLNLDKLRAGSAIVVRTKSYWYTYRVLGDRDSGSAEVPDRTGLRGREIVSPLAVGVVEPTPNAPGVEPSRRLLTLTTCHPKFSARQRLIIHAELQGRPYPASRGLPPALAAE